MAAPEAGFAHHSSTECGEKTAYEVVDIYKDLPRTNCGECGKGSCFAFATAVYLEAFPLEQCLHLREAPRREMETKLDMSREEGVGRRPSSSEQALRSLPAVLVFAAEALSGRLLGEDLRGLVG